MIGRDTLAHLSNLIRPLHVRVANAMLRGIVSLVDDSRRLQRVQVAALEVEEGEREAIDDGEHFQPYGFFAVPFAGAEAIVLFPNGDRGHPLVMAVADRRYRPIGGQPGEAGLYTDEGDEIRLARGHSVVVSTSGTVHLGSAAAAEGSVKGTARNTAEQTFLTALSTFVSAIVDTTGAPSAAKATFLTAISTFASAASSAVSTKVKVE